MEAVQVSRSAFVFPGRAGRSKLACCLAIFSFAWMSGVARLGRGDEPTPADQESPASATVQKPVAEVADTGEAKAKPPKAGKLVICGGGILPDELGRRFIEMAGGLHARLVIITTASVLADTDRVESKLTFWRRQQVENLRILHTRSREMANDAEFSKPLKDATGVWFIGGNQNWLTDTYLGTATEREIRGVLERDGVVGGTSAGAAIMSPIMIRRDRPALEEGPGFGFLPGTIVDQHFIKRNRQARLLRMLDSHPDLVGLGIDEGTALVVEGANLSVLGESQVMVCSPNVPDQPPQVRPLKAGIHVDLASLRTEAFQRHAGAEKGAEDPSPEAKDEPKDPAASALDVATVSVNADDAALPSTSDGPSDEKIGQ
jgi:cyanophycinase